MMRKRLILTTEMDGGGAVSEDMRANEKRADAR